MFYFCLFDYKLLDSSLILGCVEQWGAGNGACRLPGPAGIKVSLKVATLTFVSSEINKAVRDLAARVEVLWIKTATLSLAPSSVLLEITWLFIN